MQIRTKQTPLGPIERRRAAIEVDGRADRGDAPHARIDGARRVAEDEVAAERVADDVNVFVAGELGAREHRLEIRRERGVVEVFTFAVGASQIDPEAR